MGDHIFGKGNVAGTVILTGMVWLLTFMIGCLLALFVEGTAELSTGARGAVVAGWLFTAPFSAMLIAIGRHG